eukprot:15440067-Alexandrium_andersonii.AAC.1
MILHGLLGGRAGRSLRFHGSEHPQCHRTPKSKLDVLPASPPWEVAVPARPTGQTALSAARNPQKFGAPLSRGGRRRR